MPSPATVSSRGQHTPWCVKEVTCRPKRTKPSSRMVSGHWETEPPWSGSTSFMPPPTSCTTRRRPSGSHLAPPVSNSFFAQFLTAFPDAKVTPDELIAAGDRVVARSAVRGTHQGAFLGTPPTGKPVTVTGIGVIECADGKMVEKWKTQPISASGSNSD